MSPSPTPRLRIAIQRSGRLADRSLDLMKDAGLRVVKGANDLLFRVENYPIDLLRVRDDDIPTFVADGVADLGVVGLNVLEEHRGETNLGADTVMPLGFGRCDLKIAVPDAFAWQGPQSLEGARIATSYPTVLKDYLRKRGVKADIVVLRGAVEVAPRLKMATAICDLVSTGATLEANGLKAVATVLQSEAMLIRKPSPLDPELAHLADSVVTRFRGVTASQGAKYVKIGRAHV